MYRSLIDCRPNESSSLLDLEVDLPLRPTGDGGSATATESALQEMRASVREASSLVSDCAQDRKLEVRTNFLDRDEEAIGNCQFHVN